MVSYPLREAARTDGETTAVRLPALGFRCNDGILNDMS